MDILQVLEQIANYFNLSWSNILTLSAYIVIVVNFFKATKPFSDFFYGERITILVVALSLIVSLFSFWGDWLHLILNTVFVAIVSIGGWATTKMIAHKVGNPPTNSSGGFKDEK